MHKLFTNGDSQSDKKDAEAGNLSPMLLCEEFELNTPRRVPFCDSTDDYVPAHAATDAKRENESRFSTHLSDQTQNFLGAYENTTHSRHQRRSSNRLDSRMSKSTLTFFVHLAPSHKRVTESPADMKELV